MSTGLERFHQTGHLHFITFSCARKRPILGTPESRDTLLRILEETRHKYHFQVLGYVVMPNHVHLLVTEPEQAKLSICIQVLKQRFSRTRPEEHVWEPRYYDFNVYTDHKRIEKLRYIHRNPVHRGLVEKPEDYSWSSFRNYALDEPTPVTITRTP
jgi:putative transposase